jgi:ADP-ribose pyrophosphatase YjhB (NUDIX family)
MGVRANIRDEVATIIPLDAEEATVKREVLDWIESDVELCRLRKPATPPKHLIAYFAVVDVEHVLLVDHINSGLWLPPGGHVEPNEHPRSTVEREAMEELSLAAQFAFEGPLFLTVTKTVGRTAGHIDVCLWYVLAGDRRLALSFDDSEFTAARWFHRSEVPSTRADPNMGRFLNKLCARIARPSGVGVDCGDTSQ